MPTYFRSLADVLASPLAQAAKASGGKSAGGNRILKSTRLEDTVYKDLRRGDEALDALEQQCGGKLSTFPALSRDIYQSFYSLNVRKNETADISETAKRFNGPILEEVMNGEEYAAIKTACEGRQLPAYEAAGEFISQVADHLDDLLERAGGEKKALKTLERLEQKREQSLEKLRDLLERQERSGSDPALGWPRRTARRARSIRRTPLAGWCGTICSKTKRALPRSSPAPEKPPRRKRRTPPPRSWPGVTRT